MAHNARKLLKPVLIHSISIAKEAIMAKTVAKTVKGGTVYRSAKSGRFVSVSSQRGTYKASGATAKTVKVISGKRKDALARLADR